MESIEESLNLPYSEEAEKAVLGSILLAPQTSEKALEELSSADFYNLRNREMFAAMRYIWDRGGSIDIVTVMDALEKLGKLESSGGLEYITELSVFTPTAQNLEHYLAIVKEESTRRRLISVCTEIAQEARVGTKETSKLLDDAERRIYEIAVRASDDKIEPIAPIYGRVYRRIGELMRMDGQTTGLPSGFIDLDNLTSGMHRSDLIIIAGRPASGKSTLALNIAAHAALHEGATVAFFNLEMSKEQLVSRVMATETGVPLQNIRTGSVSSEELLSIAKGFNDIGDAAFLLDDTPGISVAELRSRCRRIKARQGLDLVIVDYLQLMQASGKAESRVQAVSEMTRNLKILARELDIPLIVLSQLSREPDKRSDHTPMMSDLRESGSIEQDADIIMMLYRPAAYVDTTEYKEQNNIAYLNVVKHRNGETRSINLTWRPELTKFDNYADFDAPFEH
ncbi:MAG: replicative DNA helicase [Clostridia bacterium]|nr:replicative DNA helicase [Clostridia bacterium]MBR3460091.1 replicative DNA helicase [Clostridia bacterium]MBR5713359.1 replicative DNA helicase [Clostridia bacterium]